MFYYNSFMGTLILTGPAARRLLLGDGSFGSPVATLEADAMARIQAQARENMGEALKLPMGPKA